MTIFYAFLVFFLWSLSFPLGKSLVLVSSPVFLTAFRMTFAGTLLLGYLAFKKELPPLTKKVFLSLTLLALFSVYITNILEFWSLERLPAAKTCFIYSLSPFITALLSYFHFKEKMTPMKWLGLSIGTASALPVIFSSSKDLSTLFYIAWPELAAIGATFASVYGWIILRILVKENLSPLFVNGMSMLIGGLLALATSFFFDRWNPIPIEAGHISTVLLIVTLLTFLSNIFCYNLYGYLLKKYTATFLSFFGLLSPIFASFHSWVILGEEPSLTIISSTAILLLGLWLVYREERRLGYIEK